MHAAFTDPLNTQRDHVLLDIPMCKQDFFGDCGPSCLMMVLSYYNMIEMTFKHKIEIWRKSVLFPLRASGLFGLATVAAEHGLNVIVLKGYERFVMSRLSEDLIYYESLGGKIDLESILPISYEIQKKKALSHSNVRVFYKRLEPNDITNVLSNFGVPLIVLVWRNTNFPYIHWVVVKGYSLKRKAFYINEPETGTQELVSFDDFVNMINMVSIEPGDTQALLIVRSKKLFACLVDNFRSLNETVNL